MAKQWNQWQRYKQQKQKPLPAPPPKDKAERTLTGVVETVRFRSEETGYTICSVKSTGRQDASTVVGACAAIWPGETLEAEGQWTRHPKHGYQFQADKMTCVPPTSARGIERYLASGMIGGIGKELAKRLVGHFGKKTLHILEKESSRLQEVEGIGPLRRKKIKESWISQHAVRDIMIFLQGHGIGTAQSARIYRQYGNDAMRLIRENPYRLCYDVWGIGFKTADSVAMSVGIPVESEIRARAGLVYVLKTLTEEGHCYCPEPELLLQAQSLLEIPTEILSAALRDQLERKLVIKEGDHIYLTPLFQAEVGIARAIRELLAARATFKPIAVDKAIPWAEKKMKLSFAPMQVEALKTALSGKVSIITGGPGVGKTTIIRALVDVYRERKLNVQLAAPTGRAAKRMEESTGQPAVTLHRLLKYTPRTGSFEHDAANPLDGDVFILDEVSMMDIQLTQAFLCALRDCSTLVLVGDIDQLPSVGPGNVLRDTIASGVVPCRQLDRIFRQKSGGLIVTNAHHVNHGEALELPDEGETSDFYMLETAEPDTVVSRVVDLVARRIPKRFGLDPMKDIQVLTPMRKNQLGAENLNAVLQEALNPDGASLQRFGRSYRVGDRVMQVRNNYDKEVFNGDIGRVKQVDVEDQKLTVDFEDRRVGYDGSDLDELVHAYACTVHKSQGSEYPAVVLLMTTQHFKLLQRNLLYTGITRGRRLVCLVGSTRAVSMAIRNNEIRMRRTGLRERLAQA